MSNMLITNMDMIFENTVTKLVQMAHKVAQMTKIHTSLNCLKVGTEPISNMLITNMDMIFENTVIKLVQIAHKMAQMTKN